MKPSHTTTAQKLTRARVQLLLGAAIFRHAQLEVETGTGSSADDGDGRLADCLQLGLRG